MVRAGQSFNRYDIWLVAMDPTTGSEISKTRPAVIVSPSQMNRNLNTVVIAPMTTTRKNWPTRVDTVFKDKSGQIALDQIRALDKMRFAKRLGQLDTNTASTMSEALVSMFKE